MDIYHGFAFVITTRDDDRWMISQLRMNSDVRPERDTREGGCRMVSDPDCTKKRKASPTTKPGPINSRFQNEPCGPSRRKEREKQGFVCPGISRARFLFLLRLAPLFHSSELHIFQSKHFNEQKEKLFQDGATIKSQMQSFLW